MYLYNPELNIYDATDEDCRLQSDNGKIRPGYKGYKNFVILGDGPGCYGIDINTTFPILLTKLIDESS